MPKRRHTPTKAELIARLPRCLRPKLDRTQKSDLALVHASNLDAISKGQGDEAMLWEWVASVLTWSKAAELLEAGVPEMTEQLELAHRLIERYSRTGRVAFSGPDYQLAKDGLGYMDQLAELADRPTAIVAADWSESQINAMAAACSARQAAPTTATESAPAC